MEKYSGSTNTTIWTDARTVGVAKVRPKGRADVYNLEVDGTHCFVVNGGIIVHNCMDAARYFIQTIYVDERGLIYGE